MARSARRTARWSRTTAGFAADLALYVVIGLAFWLAVPMLILGWTPVLITSGSMSPAVEPGDVLLIERGSPEGEWFVPGTIITYEDARGDVNGDVEVAAPGARSRLVSHRVDRIDADGAYVTRGDANATSDPRPVDADQIVGAARLLVPYIGLPVHWARDGRPLMLTVVALALVSTVLLGRFDTAATVDDRGSKPRRRRVPTGPRTDPRTVGATAALAARAAASSGRLARTVDTSDPDIEVVAATGTDGSLGAAHDAGNVEVEGVQRPPRRRFRPPPAGAILGIVALSVGTLVPAAEASFLDSSANEHNRFATAVASFDVDASITVDLSDTYCAEVTVSTGWPSPVVWEVEVDLGAAPMNGTPFSATDAHIEYESPVLTATGAPGNETVAASSPATWTFCANRVGDGPPPSPTMVLPELGDGSGTAEPAPGPGDSVTYSFTFTYPQEVSLDGVPTAELHVERDTPGNSPGGVEVVVLADGVPVAMGSSGNIRDDGWHTVTFPLDDPGPVSQTFPAGTTFRVDVELWRVRLELGGASQILLPLAP